MNSIKKLYYDVMKYCTKKNYSKAECLMFCNFINKFLSEDKLCKN